MGKAVFKQKSGLYALVVTTGCGLITPEQLNGLNRVVKEQGVQALKLTTRQTVVILSEEEKIDGLIGQLEELGFKTGTFGNTVRNVKGCAGDTDLCPRSLGDALSLGMEIQECFYGQASPHDFKISVAGCSRGCTDPLCADFGIICNPQHTYDIFIGGKGAGRSPVHGQLLLAKVERKDVFKVLEHVLQQYRSLARGKERLHKTIERTGLDAFMPPDVRPSQQKVSVDEDFLKMLGTEGGA